MNSPATANDFLRALPPDILDQWLAQSKTFYLNAGALLTETCAAPDGMYFPLSAVLSWVNWLSDGASSAIALIGREGMVGLQDMQGLGQHLVTLSAGEILQVPGAVVRASNQQSPEVHRLFTENLHALMAQASQTAICNQHHGLQQRLLRLLKAIADRIDSDTIRITHERLADLLGTRRERVSQATSALQKQEIIRCARGAITLTDRPALLANVCVCCATMRRPFAQPMLPPKRGFVYT